jgi:hypothetical protein
MFWETGAGAGSRQIGGGESDRVAKLLVVDGQQRLTSLYAVLTGHKVISQTFEERHVRIAFRPSDERFEVTDAAIEKDAEFIDDITELWNGSYKSTVRTFLTRLAERRSDPLPSEEQDCLEERIDRVRDLRDFRFQVIELNANANEEQVADIFVRINSEGVQLKQSDFILTLMSIHWEKGRVQLEQFCRDAVDPAVKRHSPKNPYINPRPDQMLRAAVGLAFRRGRLQHVYSVLRGKDLDTGDVSAERRTEQFDRLQEAQETVHDLTNWHEFLKCLTHAGFRSRRMITSENAVIYAYIVWLIGRRDMGLDFKTLRGVIARWFFMSHTTGRYTSSPESQIEADLGRLAGIRPGDAQGFCAELDRIIAANFTGDYWSISLPNRLDTSSPRSPELFAYWAALNLLDAELLFSTMHIRDVHNGDLAAPKAIERHHLFPRAHLAALGISEIRQVNAIANMAFLDWPENLAISADDPKKYWPEMIQKLSPERLKRQVEWHALPIGWEQLDYSTFLERRRALIARVVHDGFRCLLEEHELPVDSGSIADLLAMGESDTLEFKSSARWNYRGQLADKKMESVIVKTICGFLNSHGGTLLIGVDDSENVLGLAPDYATLGTKGNRDGFELFLRERLDADLSVPTVDLVKIRFETVHEKDVCVVSTAASGGPVFARSGDSHDLPSNFWVRVGNATKQLHGDDMVRYQQDHWN